MKLIPEWEAHDKCLMAWPCNKNLYNEIIKDARLEMAHLANCISDEETVYMYCNKEDYNAVSYTHLTLPTIAIV